MFTEGLIRARVRALPRVDLADRQTQYALGACAIGGLAVGLVVAIGSGQFLLAAGLAAVGVAPALLLAAYRWPYVFPYGLFVLLVPFDDLLSIGAGTLTRYLSLASVAALAVHIMARRRAASPSLALWLWLGFLLWLMITALWASDAGAAWTTIQQLGSMILLFAFLSLAPLGEGDLRRICATIVLAGVAASAYGMVLLHNNPQLAGDEGRLMLNVDGRTLDPNAFADSLLLPLSLAFVSLLNARKPVAFLLALGATIVVFGGIVVSLSREAFLACLVILAVTAWFSRRRLLAVFAAVPAVIAVPMLFPAILVRMSDALSTGGAGRTSIWSVDWLAFLQHPFFGWGAGAEIQAYNAYFLAVFQRYNAGWARPPHNTALFVAVETGIVGFLLFFGAWFAAFRPLRGLGRASGVYDLRVALTAGLLSVLLVSGFIDVIGHKDFWLVLGTAAQLRIVARSRVRGEPAAATVVYEAEAARIPRTTRSLRPKFRNGSST